jgi:hypothetical protein
VLYVLCYCVTLPNLKGVEAVGILLNLVDMRHTDVISVYKPPDMVLLTSDSAKLLPRGLEQSS